MEEWSFPPNYDPEYLPDPSERYWFPVRETMDPGAREKAIVERIGVVMRYAYEHAPFYRNKWDEAGIHPDHIASLEDFERVPVVTKAELRESQIRAEPFGDYLCVPEAEVHHIHGTSGTTGRPTVFALGRADWDAIANAHARVMWSFGIRPGDIVFVGALFSLYIGSWGIMLGAERLRTKCFPFGAGAAGQTAIAARWLKMTKPKAIYLTPSYGLHLAEVAEEEGLNPKDFRLEVIICSGEPGASIPSVRDRLAEKYAAKVIDCGTMAEMTPWLSAAGNTEMDTGMVWWQDLVYHELCDPKSFCRVPYGEQGTPVYTHLERTSQPMIRLASGDLSLWVDGPSPCGRTYPYIPKGMYGRIDDMFTIRGENVYPSDIDSVLNALPEYGGEHRVIITRDGTMDELVVRLEATSEVYAAGPSAIENLRQKAATNVQRGIGVRSKIEIVDAGTYPRSEHKARRVIDDRDLFRSLSAKLGS
ncbi:MAG: phenylacetate--CoA ligase family protein [Alphaproteobacteria bacterium]|nr:phenylacetate--CoA ligase family protein [Pseudomonadota bacterium]